MRDKGSDNGTVIDSLFFTLSRPSKMMMADIVYLYGKHYLESVCLLKPAICEDNYGLHLSTSVIMVLEIHCLWHTSIYMAFVSSELK